MRKIVLLLTCLLGISLFGLSQKPADSKATEETVKLLQKISAFIPKGIMIGHQDDLAYGHSWNVKGVSDVKQSSGDFPAVFGWELGDLELGKTYSLDSVKFSDIVKGVQWVNGNGGINTISWHCNNPLTGKNAWDVSSKLVVKSVLPGGEKNELFVKMLNRLADFFLSLNDKKGVPIPVIFRPFHEHTGSWFWWGQNLCSTEEYVALWKYTTDQLKQRGVHNLLYTYSSSGGFNSSTDYLERFPGDDIVDLLGFDTYQGGISNKEDFMNSVKKGLEIIVPVAAAHKKIPILSETGCESLPDPKWWTGTLWPSIKDFPIAYVLFWRNAHDKPNHYYVPFAGQASEADFKTFKEMDKTLFLQDLQ